MILKNTFLQYIISAHLEINQQTNVFQKQCFKIGERLVCMPLWDPPLMGHITEFQLCLLELHLKNTASILWEGLNCNVLNRLWCQWLKLFHLFQVLVERETALADVVCFTCSVHTEIECILSVVPLNERSIAFVQQNSHSLGTCSRELWE